MPRPHEWTQLIATRWCVSLRAWALLTPIAIIAAPLAASPGPADLAQVLRWMLIGAIAQIPLGLVLLLGGFLSARSPWPRPTNLVVTLCAGAVRGLVLSVLGDSPDMATRIISSALTMAVWLLVIGAVLESRERYRREVDGLLAALVARELHGRLLDEERMDHARSSSDERIAETSEQLRAIVAGATDDHALTAALLQNAIEERLRPLSHDLWFSPRPVPPVPQRRELIARIVTTEVPVIALTGAALVLLTWGSLVLHGDSRGAIVGIVIALAFGATLAAARLVHRSPGLSATVRYLGVAVIPAAAGGIAIALTGLDHEWSPIAVALGLPLITLGVATAITLSADRAETIADLRARLAEPEWDRHLGALVRRELDSNAATMLHNAVQPALTAAALQLQLAAELNEPERARDALARATRALDEARLSSPSVTSGRDRILRVADAWSGIVSVTIRLPEQELSAVEWSMLADVTDESIANSVRHGKATSIDVVIDAAASRLTITTCDDSLPGTPPTSIGLGTSWLSTVLSSMEIEEAPDGRQLRRMELARTAASDESRGVFSLPNPGASTPAH